MQHKQRHGVGWALLILVLLVTLVGAVWVGRLTTKGYQLYRQALAQMPLPQKVAQLQQEEGYTPLEQLPQTYLDAVIAVEDKRFYIHQGIDLIALVRALLYNIKSGSYDQGGSTITQQLAKTMYFTQEKLVERKIAEVFMSWDLEQNYSKEEILELYVNSIYFGEGYYGIGQAAQGYYGIDPGQMDFDQCTMMAGVPNAPSVYAPTENPELARQRQRQVWRRMKQCGYLTQSQAQRLGLE
ncbi:MAG: transglycosylase domain-containing protein [Candidatus Fournierella pullistercoris]|uniref:Penicillin-binding protein 1A n=1 Tax=Candidatus Allofournierella pullistercoris TaxID=2838597 RepID=A0A948WUF8_9FIRM|nr:transglycosylase domain-containing protein [Candidatus Fournierella pullistercoris]